MEWSQDKQHSNVSGGGVGGEGGQWSVEEQVQVETAVPSSA